MATLAIEAGEHAAIIPPHEPDTEPPPVLARAQRHLATATNEFRLALQRFEIWNVLAYDRELAGRLDKGFAAGGYLAVRSAVFEALLITLTRMFDQGARGRTSLSLKF